LGLLKKFRIKVRILTLPEAVVHIRDDVYFGELADLCLSWHDVGDGGVLVEMELLRTLGVWVVDVLLESDAEGQRDDLVCIIRESNLFGG
jgi:hypothetical protein